MTEHQRALMDEFCLKLGFIGGMLTRTEVQSLIQAAVQNDDRFRANLTYLRDMLTEALTDDLPRTSH